MLDINEVSEDVKTFGMDIQSYLLVKTGVKPVMRLCIDKSKRNKLEDIARKIGLCILIKTFPKLYSQKLEQALTFAYLSLSDELLRQTYEAEKINDRETLGRLLGYPDCCVKEFLKSFNNETDFTLCSLLNTKTKPSFYCNSIFNLESKLSLTNITYQILNNRNIFKESNTLFLIRHLPCSFDCKESIRLGKKTLELLEEHIPHLASKIVDALKRPVLYFDYFNWIVFDGIVRGNTLEYTNILPYETLVPGKIIEKIKTGNKIEVFDDKIVVFKDKEVVLDIKKQDKYRGILIDFT
jgi:hypothetical protein